MEGRAPICGFLKGDSGRGRDGRDFLNWGLGALPGPTDWLNLGKDGVGGVKEFPCPATLKLLPAEGVVGVIGNDPSCDEGDPRLVALLMGRNMPALLIEVLK